jgi:hypothetical protein
VQGAACEASQRTEAATPAPGARQASARGRELQRSRPPRFGACTRARGVGRARSAGDQQQPARTAAVKQCPATGSASGRARQAEEASSLGEPCAQDCEAVPARSAAPRSAALRLVSPRPCTRWVLSARQRQGEGVCSPEVLCEGESAAPGAAREAPVPGHLRPGLVATLPLLGDRSDHTLEHDAERWLQRWRRTRTCGGRPESNLLVACRPEPPQANHPCCPSEPPRNSQEPPTHPR